MSPSTPSNDPNGTSDRSTGESWVRRHPFISAFVVLSVIGILLSAQLHRTMWGYVFAPPPLAAEVQSIVAVDALYWFRSDVHAGKKQTSIQNLSGTPKQVLRDLLPHSTPFLRVLQALEARGRLPATWIESSALPPDHILDLVITGEGSYGRSPPDIKYFTGQALLGRDQHNREILFLSSLDVTGFPNFFEPYFEFVFIRTGNDAKWRMVSSQTFNKGDRELHWLLSMPVIVGFFEVLILLVLSPIFGLMRLSAHLQRREKGFEVVA